MSEVTHAPRQVETLSIILLLLFGATTSWVKGADNSEPDSARRRLVVVLYPHNSDGSPGNRLVDQSIRATFAEDSSKPIDVYNEYLDFAQVSQADQRLQRGYLKRKYQNRNVDLVIAGLSPALDFALANRDVFSNAPIVFCAVDSREIESRQLPLDVVGIPSRYDLEETLQLALRLHPDTENVAVVSGSASMDVYWEQQAKRLFSTYENRLKFTYLAGLTQEDLLDRVSSLPEKTIIYYLHVFQDRSGRIYVPSQVLKALAQRATAPIYGHVDTYVGRGAVGGRVFRFQSEGEATARLGLRILAGERPEEIGIQDSSNNVELFDWRQLKRWNVDPEKLPAESIILFREPTFWELYNRQVIGIGSLVIVQTVLIVGLLVQRQRWKRAENRFRQAVEAAPNGMLMVNGEGIIVLTNPSLEKLFGYTRSELLGQPVEMLVPEMRRAQHVEDRRSFFQAPDVRIMGVGREIAGVHKNGAVIAVEVGLSPLRTNDGLFVLASVIDVTERRRALADLQTTKQELRRLSERLITAQEKERRRIARELHDDFNQNLALLAVKLDLLRQHPPDSEELEVRLDALSVQIRDISTSLHELSHELHPLKLEQLGLVTSIRGLCNEISESHNLTVDFQARDVPNSLPSETALCLYRIVQESLRNVVRHSGAQEVRIRLADWEDEIQLQVEDGGVGFDPNAAGAQAGLGFVSMRERLRLVGGEISVHSQPRCGTTINVRVPRQPINQTEDQVQLRRDGTS